MIPFAIETDIALAAARVFEYVTDPSKLATRPASTVSAAPETPGPLDNVKRILENGAP